jgi:hypothetical protein
MVKNGLRRGRRFVKKKQVLSTRKSCSNGPGKAVSMSDGMADKSPAFSQKKAVVWRDNDLR